MTLKQLEEALEFFTIAVKSVEDKEIQITVPQVVRYFERLLILRGLE